MLTWSEPVVGDETFEGPATPGLSIRPAPQRAHVLVAEDDDAMRSFLEESLREEGYRVSASSNTLGAIVALLRDRADVAVVDWKMPDLDGFALLAALRRCRAELPVIFVTAYARPEVERRALDAGAAGFLPKPFRVDDLVAAIERVRRAPPAADKTC